MKQPIEANFKNKAAIADIAIKTQKRGNALKLLSRYTETVHRNATPKLNGRPLALFKW
jgi:hypothetical protein